MLNLIVSLLILPLMATDTAKQVRFTPKDLPYAYDALAPQVSEETLRFHHDKHYVGYVNKLNELIVDTPYRPHLYSTQTPQVFQKRIYFEAVDFALEHHLDFTDDCQLAEAINCKVYMTIGDYTNLKITTPEDIFIARMLLEKRMEESTCTK